MDLVTLIIALIILVNGVFLIKLYTDINNHVDKLKVSFLRKCGLAVSSPIIFFLSSFGVPDFALSTILYRKTQWTSDENLPGTLNTQCVLPVAAMALAFITVIDVDIVTLLSCIIAQSIGAYLGPRFVVRLSVTTIRLLIGLGLVVAAAFILAEKLHVIPLGGTSTMLGGYQLIIAIICLFCFGALNNIGIGSYAPTMVTVYALGLNPVVAFPIMMGASALSVPIGSMEFIRYGRYSRIITLFSSTLGLMGALCGVYLINGLNLSSLQWLVAAVLIYSGLSMLYQELQSRKSKRLNSTTSAHLFPDFFK